MLAFITDGWDESRQLLLLVVLVVLFVPQGIESLIDGDFFLVLLRFGLDFGMEGGLILLGLDGLLEGARLRSHPIGELLLLVEKLIQSPFFCCFFPWLVEC